MAAGGVLVLAGAVAGCSSATARAVPAPPTPSDPTPFFKADAAPPSPLAGEGFYLDPRGAAASALATARAEANPGDIAVFSRLARPTASWLTGQEGDLSAAVTAFSEDADEAGRTAVLVLYNIPQRDCGSFSGGGAPDGEAYKAWVSRIGASLADRPTVVILEPDAVPQALAGCGGLDLRERYQLLSESVDILARQSGTRVYLDAGNAGYARDPGVLASALRASGIERADGFALNVSNFETTEASVAYGHQISDALGGAHFVIDTSRNGAGPARDDGTDLEWCNPRGRKIGSEPTSDPGIDRVDALLWVKQPGDSDGDCRAGEPPAGQFWLEYARDLVG